MLDNRKREFARDIINSVENDPLEYQNKVTLCYDRKTGTPVEMYEEDRFLHTMVFGPSGTGKSSQIVLPLIYQDIINNECGITIFDPKEDLAQDAYELALKYSTRKVVYIDPISHDCPKVNPFAGTVDEIVNTLSKIFTSGVVKGTDEQMARNTIRVLISRSIILINQFPHLVGNNLNIKTYSDFINNRGNNARMEIVKIKERLQKEKTKMDLIDICDWFIRTYFETNSKANEICYDFRQKIEEIASNEFLSKILAPTGYDTTILDFNESIARGDIVIVNTRYSYLGHMAKTFGEFLLRLYMTAVFRRRHYQKEHHMGEYLKPNFCYIDEFATFSLITQDLFVQGRSFRVGVHICVQSRALLRVCGDQDSSDQATVVEANTRNIVLFPGMEGSDAEYYSSQFFNLTPQQILYRPFGQIVYRIVQKRNIMPPNIGLVFFVNEKPSTKSLKYEFEFDENGQLIPNELGRMQNWLNGESSEPEDEYENEGYVQPEFTEKDIKEEIPMYERLLRQYAENGMQESENPLADAMKLEEEEEKRTKEEEKVENPEFYTKELNEEEQLRAQQQEAMARELRNRGRMLFTSFDDE